jgi:uroporphyrinogen-III synthase
LLSAGFEVAEAPAISILSAWDQSELKTVRDDLRASAFDWVVLPSQNAARGLEQELRGARVVCGAATSQAIGLDAELALERFSASAALDVLRERVAPGQRILVPRAAEVRDELVDGLSAMGANVVAPIAYRTVASDQASQRLRSGGIDVVTLCSPSAVNSVASALSGEIRVVCLGQTTAGAAQSLGLRVDGIAKASTMNSLVDSVQLAVGVRV